MRRRSCSSGDYRRLAGSPGQEPANHRQVLATLEYVALQAIRRHVEDAGLVAAGNDIDRDREIAGDELGRIGLVGVNTANLGRGNDHHVWLGCCWVSASVP